MAQGNRMAQLSEATIRQQLADCHRMMVMAELMDYSGHVSARIPGTKRILILPRDASRAAVTADEMLVVDLDGKVLRARDRRRPKRQFILASTGIARTSRRSDTGHPPMSTLFTMVDRPMIAIRNYGFRFIGCPCHPDPTHIRTVEQGDAVARTLGKHSYCPAARPCAA